MSEKSVKKKYIDLKDLKKESDCVDKNINFIIKRLTSQLDEEGNFKHH